MILDFCKKLSRGVENIGRGSYQYCRREAKLHVAATAIPSPFVLAQAFTRLLISITQSVAKPHTNTIPCDVAHVIVRLPARDKKSLIVPGV